MKHLFYYEEKTMINAVSTVCIFVSDQDRAKAFYTEKLGFEVHMDAPMGPSRWIAVAPKGALTEIILYKMDENWEHYRAVMGHSQAVSFDVTNIQRFSDELKARGVRIVSGPDKEPWGTYMMIKDEDDNELMLVEQPERM